MTAMRTIIRAATKKEDEPYNILILLDNKSLTYISKLSEMGNNFYIWENANETEWDDKVVMKPDNCFTIKGNEIPEYLDIDIILCLNRGFFKFCKSFADFWHIPIILLEFESPSDEYKQSDPQGWMMVKQCEGDINVFTSDESRDCWGQLGYVIPEDNDNFCDSWNNLFQEACSLVYTRMM
jgi:hypothetical protein